MKPLPIFALAGMVLAASPAPAPAHASGPQAVPFDREQTHTGQAQPGEVVAKVRKAAALLAKQGAAGLALLRSQTSEFSWKDTYVFVVNCEADRVLANPAFPERQGGDIKRHRDYGGKPYGLELCATAQQPGGGWVEYHWLKPGGEVPLRKLSFVVSVEGRPYQVGAGLYDESLSLEEVVAIAEMSG